MGYVDIYDSRRTAFEKCAWWSQKLVVGQNGKIDYSKLAHEIRPTGYFHAEESNQVSENPNQIGQVRITSRYVVITTSDDIYGKIFRDDLVRYDGRIWRVASIRIEREWKRSQFRKSNREGTKIIELRS